MPLHSGGVSWHFPNPLRNNSEGPEVLEDKNGSLYNHSMDGGSVSSNRKRLSNLKSVTKAKTKKLLTLDRAVTDDDSDSVVGGPLVNIEHDPAFHPSTLGNEESFHAGKTAGKTLGNLKSIGKAVIHPVEATKRKATKTTAGQLSKADRPYISKEADEDYLQAHDELKRAESSGSSRKGTTDEEQENEIGDHRDNVQRIEAHRESLKAAWTTSRHVRRVRVVPKRHIAFPQNDYFVERDKDGNHVRYDWLKWLGYNLVYYTQDFGAQYIDDFDELPFDIDSSRHYIERIVLASAPWQSWAMDVRAVYRWEDPRTTTKWFALYLFLWYTQHMMGFLYGYVIYIVLKNRYFPTATESLRESMQRAVDSRGNASRWGELIDKHGSHDWLEPLLEHMGPYVQLQLGDIANMLEVFSNFYHWKFSQKTVATLLFFGSCLAVTIFADMAFCMKIFWFIAGGSFFLCWPISSHYPKYRYLVSPFKWVLWDIPTNAEWSFQYLRRQAQISREQAISMKVEEKNRYNDGHLSASEYTGQTGTIPRIDVEGLDSTENPSDDSEDWCSASSTTGILKSTDLRSFRAQSHASTGRLIVYWGGIRYVRSVAKRELWRRDFLELAEMRKVEGSKRSTFASLSPDQLEIKCTDGSKLHLEGMKERDEAFNTIIAFSSLQWQSLQILSNTTAQP